jgi:prepilin-type processing-associated H-X9-DG protein
MFCPKCGTENPDGTQLCRSCNISMSNVGMYVPVAIAVISMMLGIFSLFTDYLTALPAIVLGIISLVKISKNNGQWLYKSMAIAGISIPLLAPALLLPIADRNRYIAKQKVCSQHIRELGIAALMYAEDQSNHNFPSPPDKWCDLLWKYHINEKNYICPSAKSGKCHYSINPKAKRPLRSYITVDEHGISWIDVNTQRAFPSNVVLFFESKEGWNQCGGLELLTTENHRGKGCNVVFCDGHVEFVNTENINNLQWTADP